MADVETGIHRLKTWPEAFAAVESGDKTFEWRKADRNFQEGDIVVLQEWSEADGYSGRTITADVGFVLRAPAFGVPEGFCVFSLIDVGDVETHDPAWLSSGNAKGGGHG